MIDVTYHMKGGPSMDETSYSKQYSDLQMYTREQVAEMFACHITNVGMLTDVGCLKAIKIGKKYMYSYESIKEFETKYIGCDLSNRTFAIEAKERLSMGEI